MIVLLSFVDAFVEFDQIVLEGVLIGADVVHEILVGFNLQIGVVAVQFFGVQNKLGVTCVHHQSLNSPFHSNIINQFSFFLIFFFLIFFF